MPILRDLPVLVTVEELMAAHAPRGKRPLAAQAKALRAATQAALVRLPALIAPALLYDFFPLEKVEGQTVYLDADRALTIGPHAHLLAPANEVLVAVCTLGPELDRAVQELSGQQDMLLAIMLDSAGVVALGQIGERAFQLAEKRAASAGYGVSPSLAPGSLPGWSLTGQAGLCSLLPIEEIGLSLNEHCVIIPYKSVSFLVGLGPGYAEHAVGSVCHLCTLAARCWRRRGSE